MTLTSDGGSKQKHKIASKIEDDFISRAVFNATELADLQQRFIAMDVDRDVSLLSALPRPSRTDDPKR